MCCSTLGSCGQWQTGGTTLVGLGSEPRSFFGIGRYVSVAQRTGNCQTPKGDIKSLIRLVICFTYYLISSWFKSRFTKFRLFTFAILVLPVSMLMFAAGSNYVCQMLQLKYRANWNCEVAPHTESLWCQRLQMQMTEISNFDLEFFKRDNSSKWLRTYFPWCLMFWFSQSSPVQWSWMDSYLLWKHWK